MPVDFCQKRTINAESVSSRNHGSYSGHQPPEPLLRPLMTNRHFHKMNQLKLQSFLDSFRNIFFYLVCPGKSWNHFELLQAVFHRVAYYGTGLLHLGLNSTCFDDLSAVNHVRHWIQDTTAHMSCGVGEKLRIRFWGSHVQIQYKLYQIGLHTHKNSIQNRAIPQE